MNRLQIRNRVLTYIRNRSGYDATINDIINERCDSIAMPFNFPHLEVEVAAVTVAQTRTVAVPASMYVVQKVLNLDAPELTTKIIEPATQDWIDEQDWLYYAQPKYFSQFGQTLSLWPVTDLVYDLLLRGKRLPTPMDDDADEPEFPRDWHVIIAKLAAAEMHFILGEDERGMMVKNEALGEIAARQEVSTMQRRGAEGQIQVARKISYRRRGQYFRGRPEE